MNKRIIVVVICIFVALSSFLGGVGYGYREFKPIQLEYDTLKLKYDSFFIMPIDSTMASVWFDSAYFNNNEYSNIDRYYNIAPIIYSDKWIDKWVPINMVYLDLEEEYYK